MTKMSKELEDIYNDRRSTDPNHELNDIYAYLHQLASKVEYLIDSMQQVKQKLGLKE